MSFVSVLEKKLRLLTRLDLWAQQKALRYREGEGKLRFFRKTYLELDPSARLTAGPQADLQFGVSWTRANPFDSLLVLRREAVLQIRGGFRIFSGASIYVNKNARLILGSGYINNHLSLHCYNRIEIGEDVAIAEHVHIRDSDNHLLSSNPAHVKSSPVRIGNHVWIGVNVTILKGVTIGDGAVIAAGAVVTRDVPPRCLAAGVPARVVREGVEWQ